MAAVKSYKVAALPGSPVADAIYYVKGASDTKWRVFVTTSAGVPIEIDAITTAQLTAALDLKQDKFVGTTSQYVRGNGTLATMDKTAVGLGSVANLAPADLPLSTADVAALLLKANDADVVKLTGNQTIAGIKTFSASPAVPNATTAGQAAAYGQVTAADAILQTQIDTLNTTAASSLRFKGDIVATSNPNYPSGIIGDSYAITGVPAGEVRFIGGAGGVEVQNGDMIIAKAVNAGGTQASVGTSWTVIQNNLGAATTTAGGYTTYATDAEHVAGTVANKSATPAGVQAKINATAVKWDVSQTLTEPQKLQARVNIGAGSISDSTLQAVLTAGNTATGQSMSIQGVTGTLNHIARFGANGGWVEMANNTTSGGNFVPAIKGRSFGTSASGIIIDGQGQDTYAVGAITLVARDAAGTAAVASGNLLNVLNFSASRFRVDHAGAVTAAGVINAVVGNSSQWNDAYIAGQWNGGLTPEW